MIFKTIFDFLRYGPDDSEGFDVCGDLAVSLLKADAQNTQSETIFDELASRKAKSYEQVCEDRRRAKELEKEKENLKKVNEVMESPDIQEIVETIVNVNDMLEITPQIKEYAENCSIEETFDFLDSGVRYVIKPNGPLPKIAEKFLKYISIDRECWSFDPLGDHEDNEWGDRYYGAREYSQYAVRINNSRWEVNPELFDYITNAEVAFDQLLSYCEFPRPEISGTGLQKGTYQALWLSLLHKYVNLSLKKYGACVLYDPYLKQFYVLQK